MLPPLTLTNNVYQRSPKPSCRIVASAIDERSTDRHARSLMLRTICSQVACLFAEAGEEFAAAQSGTEANVIFRLPSVVGGLCKSRRIH